MSRFVWPLLFGVCLFTKSSFAILPSNYNTLTALGKQAELWSQIERTLYSSLPTEDPDAGDLLKTAFLLTSFNHESDELPFGRRKLIHTYGSVAKVELQITHPQFSGVFRSGGHGLARISLARQRTPTIVSSFTPGMALKILIDGRVPSGMDAGVQTYPSVNLHVMPSLDGQGTNKNVFALSYTNVLAPPSAWRLDLQVLAHFFEQAVGLLSRGPRDARTLPLLEAASVESNGASVSSPAVPFQLIFRPVAEVRTPERTARDFRDELELIPENSVLFHVFAKAGEGQAPVEIGKLVTRSRFLASSYGDDQLFFQHATRRY